MTTTYIIKNIQDFNKYFNLLKSSARHIVGTLHNFIIGFDIEYISKSNHLDSFNNSHNWLLCNDKDIATCLIQVATRDICLIFDLTKLGPILPNKLMDLLKKDCWIKLGIGIENDLAILSHNYAIGHCAGAIELKNIAIMANFSNPSLQVLSNVVLKENITKNKSICDWSSKLNNKQIEYAAKDAIISYNLGIAMLQPSIDKLIDLNNTTNNLLVNIVDTSCNNNNGNNYNNLAQNNFIGRLNEIAQKENKISPIYTFNVLRNNYFECICHFNNKKITQASNSKKNAKHLAAQKMLSLIKKK